MSFFARAPKRIKSPQGLIGNKEVSTEFAMQLKRRGYDMTEASLLRCIKENKSKTLVYYAVVGLRSVGTTKSIDTLKETITYPNTDVKVCSVLAIGAIAGADETAYLAELLDSGFRDKTYVMATIWEVGDGRAYDAVVRLAKKVLSKKLKVHCQSDILYLTEYIMAHPHTKGEEAIVNQLLALLDGLDPW